MISIPSNHETPQFRKILPRTLCELTIENQKGDSRLCRRAKSRKVVFIDENGYPVFPEEMHLRTSTVLSELSRLSGISVPQQISAPDVRTSWLNYEVLDRSFGIDNTPMNDGDQLRISPIINETD